MGTQPVSEIQPVLDRALRLYGMPITEENYSRAGSVLVALRKEFAWDMRNLTLADPDLNRDEKGASDAADWMPDESRCWFAWRVIDVRRAYGLTIDRREADALDAILAACPESSPDTPPACPNIPKERRP